MAARNRIPRQPANDMRGFREGPPPMPRGRGPVPASIEEELALRHDEMQRIIADNRLLIEEIEALRRDIPLVKEDLHVLSQAIPRLRADKEVEARELIQRGLKLEAEMRSVEPLKAEVLHLRSEAQKFEAMREEMSAKIKGLSQELKHLQAENQHISSMRSELEGLREELVRTRTACEYEKKASVELIEQRQVIEKNLISMSREVDNLRAELEKRSRGPGAGAYGALKPSPDMGYRGTFGDSYGADKGPYGGGPWMPYESRGFPRH